MHITAEKPGAAHLRAITARTAFLKSKRKNVLRINGDVQLELARAGQPGLALQRHQSRCRGGFSVASLPKARGHDGDMAMGGGGWQRPRDHTGDTLWPPSRGTEGTSMLCMKPCPSRAVGAVGGCTPGANPSLLLPISGTHISHSDTLEEAPG